MKPRERIITTLYHEEPDKVPFFDFLYNEISIRKLLGETKRIRVTSEMYMKAQLMLGFDHVVIFFDPPEGYKPARASNDIIVSASGTKSRVIDDMAWYIGGTIKTSEDLDNWQPPDPYAPGRTRTIRRLLKKYGEEIAFGTSIGGVFTDAWMMTGFDVFVKAMYTNPSFIHRLMDILTKNAVELGKIAIDEGIEFLWIADDFGDNHGPMVTPDKFRRFILPYLKRQVEILKKRGAWVFLHCDGNVNILMDDIVNTGIDAFHPCERKARMNLAVIKQKYGDKITLFGNVEASNLIPFGSYKEIDKQIRECFNIAAPGGGYIFGSDHSIHPGIPPEKARFLFNQAQKYREYSKVSIKSLAE